MSFAPQNKELRTTDLSQRLGYNLATVSRTLQILKRFGFLQQNSRTKLFRLGPTISQLAAAISRSMRTDFIHIVKPHADLLCEDVGSSINSASVSIEVLSSETTILVYNIRGSGPLQTIHTIGEPMPVHGSAGGKAILAFSSPEIVAGFLKAGLQRLTDKTITTPKALLKELDAIRKRGYAVDLEEVHAGIVAVAAPIFNLEGEPVAAITLAGAKFQLENLLDSTLPDQVKKTAQDISSELYHNNGDHLSRAE